MSVQQYLPIGSVARRPDARPLVDADVAALMASVRELGLLNPISCRVVGEGYEVIAGSNRLEAMAQLGEREILATILDLDDDHAELAMIDENLCRAELSPADRAAQMARRKAIYERLHPETSVGENQHTRVRQLGEGSAAERFTANTASATGQSERKVQRDAERGEKIEPAVLATISASDAKHIKTGAYLDELKTVPREEQAAKVERDKAEPPAPRVRAPASCTHSPARETAPEPPAPAANDFAVFIALVDRVEAFRVADLIKTAGRRRSVLGQRASGLVDFASSIMEALDR